MKHVGKQTSKKALRAITEANSRYFWDKTQEQIKAKEEIMKKTTKNNKQIITVPSASQTTLKSAKTTILKPKKTKTLSKPRSVHSRENTLAYYNCLIDQVANPVNKKVKITQLTHECKCSKSEVALARQLHKEQLVQKLAQSYKTFGESLGHYLHADIVGCAKELTKK